MKKFILLSLLAALIVALAFPMEAGAQEPPKGPGNFRVKGHPTIPDGTPRHREAEILVKFKPGVPEDVITRINAAHGVKTLQVSNLSRYRLLAVPPGRTAEEMVRAYGADPSVEVAQLNHIAYLLGPPDDPEYEYQWHYGDALGGINIEPVWGDFLPGEPNRVSGYNGDGVVVAVIDTGLAYWGPNNSLQAPEWESQGAKVVNPYDFANDDPYAYDDHGHGTHVANTVSQNTNNGLLAAGVANGASIMPIKVLDSAGSGTEYEVCQGIYWAVDHGADIINMSLAFPVSDPNDVPALQEAIEAAYAAGITVVAASGNDAGPVLFPAAFDSVIAVGAVKWDGEITYYSNRGSAQVLTAPGGQHCYPDDIVCQLLGGNWYDQNGDGWPDGVLQETFYFDLNTFSYQFDDVFYEGTSMASPHVAAVAALVIEKAWELDLDPTPDYVRGILTTTARDVGSVGWDPLYGFGIVDAPAAVAAVVREGSPPVASDDSTTTQEDTAVTIDVLSNDTDADEDPLTVTSLTQPSDGTAAVNGDQTVTYTPDPDYNGQDSFTYTANDSAADSNIATVSIAVNPVNDLPVALDDAYNVDENATLDVSPPGVLGNDSDVDASDTLSAVLDTDVSNGTLSLSADGSFTYTPMADWSGTDSFTYKANDGTADSNIATVTISVDPVNDPPVAHDQTVVTAEDKPIDITLTGSDPDGDELTHSVVNLPSHGNLSGIAPNLTYTPDADYDGPDSFTFKVNDGRVYSDPATISITVNPVNDAPVAVDDAYSVDEDTTLTVSAPGVLGNDSDVDVGDILTALLDTDVSNGTLDLNADGSFTYAPDQNFCGVDIFTHTVSDDNGGHDTATVTIHVICINDPPVADAGLDQTVTLEKGSASVTVSLDGSGSWDPDGDALTTYEWVVVKQPKRSEVYLTNPSGAFTNLTVDKAGRYVLRLTVWDTGGLSHSDDLVIEVTKPKGGGKGRPR